MILATCKDILTDVHTDVQTEVLTELRTDVRTDVRFDVLIHLLVGGIKRNNACTSEKIKDCHLSGFGVARQLSLLPVSACTPRVPERLLPTRAFNPMALKKAQVTRNGPCTNKNRRRQLFTGSFENHCAEGSSACTLPALAPLP